jgi:hypothetical protein
MRKYLFVIILLAFTLTACYSEFGNPALTSEESREIINSADTINIIVHNHTYKNDIDVYVGPDKVGDISGKYKSMWEGLEFTDSAANIIRIGKENSNLLFDNLTIYDENDKELFIMKENKTIFGVSYEILDIEENKIATLKRGALQRKNSATIKATNGRVIAKMTQSPLMNDFDIKFYKTDAIDKESLILICINYMMLKINPN